MRKLFTLFTMFMVAFGVSYAATETFTFSEQNLSNQEEVTTLSATNFTMTFDKGTNNTTPKYFTSGSAVRIYGGNTLTISATSAITAIEITFGGSDGTNEITANVGTYANGAWSGNANEVVFTVGGTKGNRRLSAITVTTGGEAAVATPTITLAGAKNNAGRYTGDVTATFSHANASASFFYTLDGSAPTQNSSNGASVVISKQEADVTLNVIAVVDGKESAAATQTILFGNEDQVIEGLTDDEITSADITAEKASTYVEVQNITKKSGAVYYAQAAYTTDGYVQLRSANSNSGIVSTTSGGKIKKVSLTWGSAGSTPTADGRTIQVYGKASAYTNPTELYNTATQGELLGEIVKGDGNSTELIISGDYEYVGIRSKNGALYANFTFSWEAGEAAAVATPVITPALATVVESQEVTITCATAGAQVYYNINDDADPDANSILYNGPFTVTENSVIKAIAILGNDKSKVASASITIVEPVTIADANEWTENKNDQVVKLTNAKVLYIANSGKDIYVREGDNAIMLYNTGLELSANDVLNGTVTFNFSYYYGIPEFTKNTATSLDNVVVTASDEAAEPVVTTVSEIAGLQHRCDLVTIKGEALVISDSKYYFVNDATNDTIQLYDKYGTGALADLTEGTKYDVVGLFGNIYKGQSELYVISMAEASAVKLGDVNGDGNVDVSDVVALANYVMGSPASDFVEAAADINGTDGIDIADVVALASKVMGD